MKTKHIKQALLALALLLAAAWWGGCGDPCAFEKQCPRTSTTVYGLDTVYYPYVGDFMNDGRIYTYKITVDGNTFIRSYKMTDFVHKTKVELDPLLSDDCNPYTSCDTLITKWYEMKCEEVNGQGSLIFKTRGESSMLFQFFNEGVFYRDDWDGYSIIINSEKWDTSWNKKLLIPYEWVEVYQLSNREYLNVTVLTETDSRGDTTYHKTYNRDNGIIHLIENINNQKNEIKLLDIM